MAKEVGVRFSPRKLYRCKSAKANAYGRGFEGKSFTVFAGSAVSPNTAKRFTGIYRSFRDRLFLLGVLAEKDGVIRFAVDHTFPSPGAAASVVLGTNADGYEKWVEVL